MMRYNYPTSLTRDSYSTTVEKFIPPMLGIENHIETKYLKDLCC